MKSGIVTQSNVYVWPWHPYSSDYFCVFFRNHAGGGHARRPRAIEMGDMLPDAPGKEIVSKNCQLCHTLERVVTSHREKAEWEDLVSQMVDRGCPLTTTMSRKPLPTWRRALDRWKRIRLPCHPVPDSLAVLLVVLKI